MTPAASGFVAHIKGAKSHAIVTQALEILANLDHRGAVGADPLLGDGAGILIQIPDALFRTLGRRRGPRPAAAGRLRGGDVLPAAATRQRASSSPGSSRSSSPRKASG